MSARNCSSIRLPLVCHLPNKKHSHPLIEWVMRTLDIENHRMEVHLDIGQLLLFFLMMGSHRLFCFVFYSRRSQPEGMTVILFVPISGFIYQRRECARQLGNLVFHLGQQQPIISCWTSCPEHSNAGFLLSFYHFSPDLLQGPSSAVQFCDYGCRRTNYKVLLSASSDRAIRPSPSRSPHY